MQQDDIRYSDWENASRAIRGEKVDHFQPFHSYLCWPGCNKTSAIMISPVHMAAEVDCPRCGRSLTAVIRRKIKNRAIREKENAEIFRKD